MPFPKNRERKKQSHLKKDGKPYIRTRKTEYQKNIFPEFPHSYRIFQESE